MNIKKFIRVIAFITIDFCAVYGIVWIAYTTRSLIGEYGILDPLTTPWSYFSLHAVWMAVFLAVFSLYEGLYTKRYLFLEEARTMIRMISFWSFSIIVILALSHEMQNFSRTIIIMIFSFSLLLIPLVHYFGKKALIILGLYRAPMLIIGAGNAGLAAAHGILSKPYLGYNLIGFLDDDPEKKDTDLKIGNDRFPVLGSLSTIDIIVKQYDIRSVVIAIPSLPTDKLTEITNKAHHLVRRIMVIPNIKGISLTNTELHYLFDQQLFLLKLSNNLDSYINVSVKRIFDVIVSISLLPILLPLIIFIGILIKLESPGPVFFTHRRVGKRGVLIPILKFRSMYRDSKERLDQILRTDVEAKAEWETNFKLKNDPRITKVGSFLRTTSLDELPQIFNVLAGQMSLVGPRPVIQEEIDKYYRDDADYYHMVLPGITGLWQVNGRSETSYKYRVGIDIWYVLNWSLWLDIVILFKTIKVVLKKEGAY